MQIKNPTLDTRNQALCVQLKKHGWNITWHIDPLSRGNASSDTTNQTITFRQESLAKDQGAIYHELLHFDLRDRGYPAITRCASAEHHHSVIMLNDVFQHIMMEAQLEEAGYSLKTQEEPSIIRQIDMLAAITLPPEAKEMLVAILYIRAHCLKIRTDKLEELRRHIERNHRIYDMPKINEIIGNRLPQPGSSVPDYKRALDDVLFAFDLQNEVTLST